MADTAILRRQIEAELTALDERASGLRGHLRALDTVDRLSAELDQCAERRAQVPGGDTLSGKAPAQSGGDGHFEKYYALLERDGTIADAAEYALELLGGEAHGQAILQQVLKVKKIGGNHKLTALAAAMARNERFEKVANKRNYWRLAGTRTTGV